MYKKTTTPFRKHAGPINRVKRVVFRLSMIQRKQQVRHRHPFLSSIEQLMFPLYYCPELRK